MAKTTKKIPNKKLAEAVSVSKGDVLTNLVNFNIENKVEKIERKIFFNEIDHLGSFISSEKIEWFKNLDGIEKIDILGAKETGKTYPVYFYGIYLMEKYQYASIVSMMKHSTASTSKTVKQIMSIINHLRNSERYKLPYEWDIKESSIHRIVDKKNKSNNQIIAAESFENYDRASGVSLADNGAFLLVVLDEVIDKNGQMVERSKWQSDLKSIKSNYNRRRNVFLANNPTMKDVPPFLMVLTMNPWSDKHPEVVDANLYFPENDFINWALGFDYMSLWNQHKSKVGGGDIIYEFMEYVDANWEDIKKSLSNNHTKMVDVKYNQAGVRIATRYIRTTKLANPTYRVFSLADEREAMFNEIRTALITGDRYALAETLGLANNGLTGNDKRFNLPKSVEYTDEMYDKMVNEEHYKVISMSMGWDHDANRGPVGVVNLIMARAEIVWKDNATVIQYTEPMLMTMPYYIIEGYGSGARGQNTKIYHEEMIEMSRDAYNKYFDPQHTKYGVYLMFDDDDGSYIHRMFDSLCDIYPNIAKAVKHGKIDNGGYEVIERDNFQQELLASGMWKIHSSNELLLDFFKLVPFETTERGDKKRSTKGEWATRYKDISNANDYSLYPLIGLLQEWILRGE